jgi:ABC-type iron transport system FetAB ATPase subunit
MVLEDIDVTFPVASTIAITASSDEDRRALAHVLTREVIPAAGHVSVAGAPMASLHQATIANRIGYATSRPVMFVGSYGDNVVLPLKLRPFEDGAKDIRIESARSGNSLDSSAVDWFGLAEGGGNAETELRQWWVTLIKDMGLDRALFGRGIEQRFDADRAHDLALALVKLRPDVRQAILNAGLDSNLHPFAADQYNPALPVAENLIFATPKTKITAALLEEQDAFLQLLVHLNLERDLLQLAADMVDLLRQIFGVDGTDHPMFRKLGLEPSTFEAAVTLRDKQSGAADLSVHDKSILLAVTFAISAERLGAAFPNDIIDRVLQIRQTHGAALQDSLSAIYSPISDQQPVAGLTVLENALFGLVSESAGNRADALKEVVGKALYDAGLEGLVLDLIFDMPLTLGGTNLPALLVETLAISRATIKRPQVLILDQVLSSYDAETRRGLHARLRRLLPQATIICLEPAFETTEGFDAAYIMQQGRLSTVAEATSAEDDSTVSADLGRKLRALEQTDLFAGLDRKQLRLLAFGARWYTAQAGEYVFRKDDDPTSGAFLVVSGEADLLLPMQDADDQIIATSGPGQLVGELGVIRDVPRALDMRAASDLTCLRIGAEEFLDVVGNDARTAYKLLQVVAGYVSK